MNVKDLKEGEYYLYGLIYPRLLLKFLSKNISNEYEFYIYDSFNGNRFLYLYDYEAPPIAVLLNPAPKLFRVLYEN